GEDVFDVGKGVLEHALPRPLKIRLLPIKFELALVARNHRIKSEVHRTHIERCNFGLESRSRLDALFDRHVWSTAGGDVYHDMGALFDDFEERGESLRRLVWTAILRIARVKMDDGRTRLRRPDGGICDFLGSDR